MATASLGKRLVKQPKAYVRDSGLLHALLGVRDMEDLLGNPVAGASGRLWRMVRAIWCWPGPSIASRPPPKPMVK